MDVVSFAHDPLPIAYKIGKGRVKENYNRMEFIHVTMLYRIALYVVKIVIKRDWANVVCTSDDALRASVCTSTDRRNL